MRLDYRILQTSQTSQLELMGAVFYMNIYCVLGCKQKYFKMPRNYHEQTPVNEQKSRIQPTGALKNYSKVFWATFLELKWKASMSNSFIMFHRMQTQLTHNVCIERFQMFHRVRAVPTYWERSSQGICKLHFQHCSNKIWNNLKCI